MRLAIDSWKASGDDRLKAIAVKTLDAMGWGPLYDERGGGFFRCSAGRDWSRPQTAKLLDVNAALLRLYLYAGDVLEIPRFSDRASGVLRYIQTALADPQGGWWSSAESSGRFLTDANAAMAGAALDAARSLPDDGLRAFALASLERVLLASYRPGDGVGRCRNGVRGLLSDQIAMATANLDAFHATDNVVYEMMAEELTRYAIRTMWDHECGGFFDRAAEPDDVGLLRQRLKPFVSNCEAAQMLRRLAAVSGDNDFARRADAALAAIAPAAFDQGPLAAHYLLALGA